MDLYGIQIPITNIPKLDPNFIPIGRFNRAFLKTARKPLGIAVERADGQIARVDTFIHGTPDYAAADRYYLDRLVKTLLWMKGGFKVYVSGDRVMYEYLKAAFADGGSRDFDFHFMANVYERPFEVVYTEDLPREKDAPQAIGGHLEGCRIGFDAGGSDRKVSAVMDGESVYDEEVVWFPKTNADPQYHYLFLQIPKDLFEAKVKDIYIRAIRDTFGDIPFEVANDGDVSALAGMLSLGEPNVLGIAMGTSEAVGFVDREGRITGWLNELAFVPVDAAPDAMVDEWSGDIGCGVKYFSQDSVIKLAPRAGIALDETLSPAEKLKVVQKRMEADDPAAAAVYDSIGVYLGHTLAYYYELYGMRHVLLLGRVMSGKGGDRVLAEAKRVLREEYPEIADAILPSLPDERFRRVGQSAAAASLPALRG